MNANFIRQVGPLRWAFRYGRRQFRKRILRRDTYMRLPTGLRMLLPRDNQHATEVFVTGANVDHGSEALFARFALPDADFLDIGANAGYYSLYLAPLVRRVYAFEPDPRNLAALSANAATAKNVLVCSTAVSDRSGQALLDIGSGGAESHLTADLNSNTIRVETISIDEFVQKLSSPRISLIKTDIEGHDLKALVGAATTITTHQPLILSEIETSPALSDLLAAWDYRSYALVRESPSSEPRLIHLTDEKRRLPTKMLFLVPKRFISAFDVFKSGGFSKKLSAL